MMKVLLLRPAARYEQPYCEHCLVEIRRRDNESERTWAMRRFCTPEHYLEAQALEVERARERKSAPGWPAPVDEGKEEKLYGQLRYQDVTVLKTPVPPAIRLR